MDTATVDELIEQLQDMKTSGNQHCPVYVCMGSRAGDEIPIIGIASKMPAQKKRRVLIFVGK